MKGSAKKILCKRLRENVENPLACGAAADWIEVQHVLLAAKDAEIERLQVEFDDLAQKFLAKESVAELREEIGV